MHRLSEDELEQFYWMDFDQYFVFDENGMAVFKPDTPQRILDSYAMTH